MLTYVLGRCLPGNNESAGVRKAGRTNRGNNFRRSVLTQCARAATNKQKSVLQQFYRSIYLQFAMREEARGRSSRASPPPCLSNLSLCVNGHTRSLRKTQVNWNVARYFRNNREQRIQHGRSRPRRSKDIHNRPIRRNIPQPSNCNGKSIRLRGAPPDLPLPPNSLATPRSRSLHVTGGAANRDRFQPRRGGTGSQVQPYALQCQPVRRPRLRI